MEQGGVVYQKVETPLLAFDAGEEFAYLFIVAVVAGHSDALATSASHCLGGFRQTTRQWLTAQLAGAGGR
ncbi:hypothetical protein D3C86_1874690 [compost metagenome]